MHGLLSFLFGGDVMKKPVVKAMLAFTVVCALLLSLAACNSGAPTTAPTTAAAPTTADAKTAEPTVEPAVEPTEAPAPLGLYDPPIEITSCIIVGADTKFDEGQDINNNVWTRYYEEALGIKLKFDWVANSWVDWDQKLNLAITSNELPDYFVCNSNQFKSLYDNEMIQDLSQYFEDYSTPDTKKMLTADPIGFKSAQIEGKLFGLPSTDSSVAQINLLWIRNDWLKALNLPMPTTMQELIDTARAFTKQDPDKNGKDDTYGIAFNKGLWSAFASVTGFVNGYHAYPYMWLDDGKGGVMNGSIQPEFKNALAALQGMYKDGLIDPEFGVKDADKAGQEMLAGRYGIQYGSWWNPDYPLATSKVTNPNADWVPLLGLSADDKPVKPGYSNFISSYLVVRKGYEHPEAIVKMMNLWTDVIINPTEEKMGTYIVNLKQQDVVYYKYINVMGWDPAGGTKKWKSIVAALEAKDKAGLGIEEAMTYDNIQLYLGGDMTMWAAYAEFGPEGSSKYIDIAAQGQSLCNLFYGAATPTMAEKMSALQKMHDTMVTNVILGASLDTFDKFVEDWKKLGGDEITKEVNEWYAKNK